MALITKTYTFTAGTTIVAAEHNTNYNTIYNEFNGQIDDANIKSAAGITDGKLAQISTAGKVSGAALTSLTSVPSGAGLIPPANVFPAGMITLWSGTIANIPSGWVICDGTNSTPDLTACFVSYDLTQIKNKSISVKSLALLVISTLFE